MEAAMKEAVLTIATRCSSPSHCWLLTPNFRCRNHAFLIEPMSLLSDQFIICIIEGSTEYNAPCGRFAICLRR